MKRRKQGRPFSRFDVLIQTVAVLIAAVVGYPLWFILIASISDPSAVDSGKVLVWPVGLNFEGYIRIFATASIWRGYANTLLYTFAGVLIHLAIVLPCAYALSRPELTGRKVVTWFILFTMLFSGGLVPTYLVVRSLGMLDSMWALVIPGAAGAWSILVARAFFASTVPAELVEAARMDGANDLQIFFRMALPLSTPIIVTLGLFHGVGLWNEYFRALVYLSSRDKYPLQLILREILIVSQGISQDSAGAGSTDAISEQLRLASLIKYSVMIVSTLPLLIIYPFVQRFFVKGALVGSVRG